MTVLFSQCSTFS